MRGCRGWGRGASPRKQQRKSSAQCVQPRKFTQIGHLRSRRDGLVMHLAKPQLTRPCYSSTGPSLDNVYCRRSPDTTKAGPEHFEKCGGGCIRRRRGDSLPRYCAAGLGTCLTSTAETIQDWPWDCRFGWVLQFPLEYLPTKPIPTGEGASRYAGIKACRNSAVHGAYTARLQAKGFLRAGH